MKYAYYFSHDSNAKDDPKCVLLIEQLGLEGYGIFWVLIETLRDQPDYKYPLALIPALARRYNTTAEKMRAVVQGYNLFTVDDNDFFSLSLIRRMEHLEEKRLKRSIAGKKGNQARWQIANESQCDNNAITNGSQSIAIKGNISKDNQSIIPYSEIIDYLNLKAGTKYRHSSNKTKDLIKARYNDQFTFDDFKSVIDKKVASWLKTDMAKYLRPETLFGTKFESYLNEIPTQSTDKPPNDGPYKAW